MDARGIGPPGLKPHFILLAYAALKRRSSTAMHAFKATHSFATGSFPSLLPMDLFGDAATPLSSTRFLLAAR